MHYYLHAILCCHMPLCPVNTAGYCLYDMPNNLPIISYLYPYIQSKYNLITLYGRITHKSVINFPTLPATPCIMPDTPLYIIIILVLYPFSCLGLYMWAASLAET